MQNISLYEADRKSNKCWQHSNITIFQYEYILVFLFDVDTRVRAP